MPVLCSLEKHISAGAISLDQFRLSQESVISLLVNGSPPSFSLVKILSTDRLYELISDSDAYTSGIGRLIFVYGIDKLCSDETCLQNSNNAGL